MNELVRFITMQDGPNRTVAIGVGALGVACGMVGCFALLRRRALLGDAVAHASLPGICLAFMLIGERNLPLLLVGALVMGVVGASVIGLLHRATRVKDDALIAIVIGSFFGLGVVLLSVIQRGPSGNQAGIQGFIYGKAASMVRADAITISVVACVLVAMLFALFKELRLVTFDSDFARGLGRPVRALDGLILAMICVCTVIGLPAVGLLMVVALLIVPAATARCWTESLGTMVVLAGIIGGVTAIVGAGLSAVLPAAAGAGGSTWPTGPMIVLSAGSVFVVSALIAPRRGVIAGLVRHHRAKRQILARVRAERVGAGAGAGPGGAA